MNSPVRMGVSPTAASTPQVFPISGLKLYFPTLELWVARSVTQSTICCLVSHLQLCPPRSTIHHLTGSPATALPVLFHDLPPCWVLQLPSCYKSSPPGCPSLPLLPVWMNVSSLTPWLSDFHTVQFSVSSGCFLFLNCCCPFGCARRHSVSTYASILAGSLNVIILLSQFELTFCLL